jgi:ABC-type phosphate transport system substrate-binding protein
MPRMTTTTRGIVLVAAVAALALAACTPPMPPDVLAARAEAQIVCQGGDVAVSVPETLTGSMSAVGGALAGVCPEDTVTETTPDQPAPVALVDKTPTPADIAAFSKTNCPTGSTIVVPAFGYPVTIAYNVVGLEGVVMTPQAVAGILGGTVTSWEDPLITDENPDFDFSGLPDLTLMSVETAQGSVEAMTAWLTQQAPEAWTKGIIGTLEGSQAFPNTTDMITEMTAIEGSIAVLPIFQAFNNVLATANLPVYLTDSDGQKQEIVVTTDDVQLYKVGSGATQVTKDESGNLFASPATGGIPVDGNFDLAASKIVLAEGQPLVGWPVIGYAHLLVCDDAKDAKPLAFAQYVVRLAGQGSLETFGLTPMPEPIRIQTFAPLKVTVDPNASVAPTTAASSGSAPAEPPSASPTG